MHHYAKLLPLILALSISLGGFSIPYSSFAESAAKSGTQAKAIAMKPLQAGTSQESLVLTDDVKVAEAQVAKFPDDPEAQFLLAIAYSRTPYFEKAFFAAKKAKQMIKKSEGGYASFDARIGDYEAMVQDPTLSAEERATVFYRLGFAYYMKGYLLEKNYIRAENYPGYAELSAEMKQPQTWYNQSESAMRQVIAMTPEDVWARNYLGYLLVDINESANLDKAIGLWEESVTMQPNNNPGAYMLLGEAWIKKGDLRKAIQYGSKGLASRALLGN